VRFTALLECQALRHRGVTSLSHMNQPVAMDRSAQTGPQVNPDVVETLRLRMKQSRTADNFDQPYRAWPPRRMRDSTILTTSAGLRLNDLVAAPNAEAVFEHLPWDVPASVALESGVCPGLPSSRYRATARSSDEGRGIIVSSITNVHAARE
jgi:hypothetical protein